MSRSHRPDTTRIALAGHSCGGAQALFNAADPHVRTLLMLNSGMGDITMARASSACLAQLHSPVLYLTGGPSDIAYANAMRDYDRINHVPVVSADLPTAGHGGTYGQSCGGPFGQLVRDWLDLTLRGRTDLRPRFLAPSHPAYPGWTLKNKRGRKL